MSASHLALCFECGKSHVACGVLLLVIILIYLLASFVLLNHLAAGVIEVLDVHTPVGVLVGSRPSLGVVADAVFRLIDD